MKFTDRSIGQPTSWTWNFGDGQGSAEQNPLHTYWVGRDYTVILTASNEFGSSDKSKSQYIIAIPALKSKFSADPGTGQAPLTVKFTDRSLGNPTSWQWDFGDGTTGTGRNPDHYYRATGVYDITLTASNQYTSTSQTKKQYISVINIPSADFVADRTKGQAPLEVRFTDLSKGNPTSWKWDFGDGWISSDRNPVHTYTTNGMYTVSLTAANANGQDTATLTNYIVVTQGPIANFMVDQRIGKAPFIVKFHDLSTGNPTRWFWEFGDGMTSAEQNPQHVYQYEGAYDVRLTVSNQYGSDTSYKSGTPDEVTVSVTISPTPAPLTTTEIKPTATAAKPVTTQAPVSISLVIGALAICVFTIAGSKKR